MKITDEMIDVAAKVLYNFHNVIIEYDDVEGQTWGVPWEDIRESYPATYEACVEDSRAVLEAALTIAPAQEPVGYITKNLSAGLRKGNTGIFTISNMKNAHTPEPVYLTTPDQSARIAELEAEVEALKHDNASYVQANSEYLTRIAELEGFLSAAVELLHRANENTAWCHKTWNSDYMEFFTALKRKGD